MTPEERGIRAQQLLNEQIVKDAFNDIRNGLIANLEACPIGDMDTQHEIALSLQLLKRLKDTLQKYGQETVIINHRKRNLSFMESIRERIA